MDKTKRMGTKYGDMKLKNGRSQALGLLYSMPNKLDVEISSLI